MEEFRFVPDDTDISTEIQVGFYYQVVTNLKLVYVLTLMPLVNLFSPLTISTFIGDKKKKKKKQQYYIFVFLNIQGKDKVG